MIVTRLIGLRMPVVVLLGVLLQVSFFSEVTLLHRARTSSRRSLSPSACSAAR